MSEEDNGEDPFASLFEIPGSQLSLTANRMVQDFTITTDSYVLLCTHVYNVLCAQNPGFADKISESAFQYYAIILLWQRLSQFLPPRSSKSSPFFEKLLYFQKHLTGIPIPLEIYLKGIGNFNHPYLGEMRFRLPEPLINEQFDLTTGTFGKVSAETHFLYESFPAPGIAALRILADIGKTNTFLSDSIWDLPKHLRPDSQDNSNVERSIDPPKPMPTKNLLGWSPAQILTKNQLELFSSCGIESTVSETDISKFFENSSKLLTTISRYFDGSENLVNSSTTSSDHEGETANDSRQLVHKRQMMLANRTCYDEDEDEDEYVTTKIKSKEKTPEVQPQLNDLFDSLEGFTNVKRLPFTGSVIQGLSSIRKVSEPSEFDRCGMYCDGINSVSSSVKVNDNLVTGAVIGGYRMPKEPIMCNKHSWSCYDFNKYEHVPESWISTRNSIYKFGNVEGLNKSMWTTGTTDKKLIQYSFIKKHMIGNEDNWNVYM